jgi:hypothetical protein
MRANEPRAAGTRPHETSGQRATVKLNVSPAAGALSAGDDFAEPAAVGQRADTPEGGREHEDVASYQPGIVAGQTAFLPRRLDARGDVERNDIRSSPPVSHGRAAGRLKDILEEFSMLFTDSERSGARAFPDLFGFARDFHTNTVLKNWNPFDMTAPSQPNILLGLLMGTWGRRDLLDCYAFPEFFCILAQLHIMDANDSEEWGRKLMTCMDRRIREVGMLTRDELDLVHRHCRDLDLFSVDTRQIMTADGEYYELHSWRDRPDPSKKRVVGDVLKRMKARYARASSSETLVFATSAIQPDTWSIFRLPQREQVAQESNILLKNAVAMTEDLLARFR